MDTWHHELTVACGPDAAFDLFTSGMGTWWDPAYSPDPASYVGIEVTPEVGGAVTMLTGPTSEDRYVFGHVTRWAPSERFEQTFWLAMSAEHPSTIGCSFQAVDGVCTVAFEHGGWTPDNVAVRYKYADWPTLLGRFATAAARL